jgi:23S rRNA (guanine2445-N2)-methyltransferase / 23S rRNA (guanine2069-N7)-methyltransferase
MPDLLSLFATCPRGTESLLEAELQTLGASNVAVRQSGVAFEGSLENAYTACLWSRIASRVLLGIAVFPAPSSDELYAGVRAIPWEDHLSPDGTLAVDFFSARSEVTHTHFGALRVKDAVVDRFRDMHGRRPDVDLERPDIRINVYLFQDEARVSLDLSGDSLHRRGYRQDAQAAPLKENLAAALLIRARWPEVAAQRGALVDPMCGSGTLPIEAAMIAGDIAPGIGRQYYGFNAWLGHDDTLWERLLGEARERRDSGGRNIPTVVGYDYDRKAVAAALANVNSAGLRTNVHIERRELPDVELPSGSGEVGLIIANPPYGRRMGDLESLGDVYTGYGDLLRDRFFGWNAGLFTGNPGLIPNLRLKPRRSYDLFNGAIPCKLATFKMASAEKARSLRERSAAASGQVTPPPRPAPTGPGVEMLTNRIRKDLRHYGKWARRSGITCYRLYDTDLPEYALAADLYHGAETWVHAQGYDPPSHVDPELFERRQQDALQILAEILDIPPANIHYKLRRRQRGTSQYEKLESEGEFREISEAGSKYWINFTDYLDTGIYLDHRPVRTRIRELAEGRRFLNMFGYTGTATVSAAAGGATSTLTVDLSRTYLDWALRNIELNGLNTTRNKLEQYDCLEWLQRESARGRSGSKFGLILLDPPTFSNSKKMRRNFDIQRDHPQLLTDTLARLDRGGTLIFSTNRRNFKMEWTPPAGVTAKDITNSTIPKDFERNPKVHHCFEITSQTS